MAAATPTRARYPSASGASVRIAINADITIGRSRALPASSKCSSPSIGFAGHELGKIEDCQFGDHADQPSSAPSAPRCRVRCPLPTDPKKTAVVDKSTVADDGGSEGPSSRTAIVSSSADSSKAAMNTVVKSLNDCFCCVIEPTVIDAHRRSGGCSPATAALHVANTALPRSLPSSRAVTGMKGARSSRVICRLPCRNV